jgi:hypothetical protein
MAKVSKKSGDTVRSQRSGRVLDFENEHVMSAVSLNLKVLEESSELALRLEAGVEDITRLPRPLKIIVQLISDEDTAPFRWIRVNSDKI